MVTGAVKQRLVVGISGSSGAILGIRLLQALQHSSVETHLVVTPSARLTIQQETNWRVEEVLALAHTHYAPHEIGAAVASGSFQTAGMVVIPCSIKTLSAIANSYASDLLSRAADVTLKEGRPLVLVVREAPLHPGHLRLMKLAAAAGAVIFPPAPAFYAHPQTVDELVDNIIGRVLRRVGIENDLYAQWQGMEVRGARESASSAPVETGGSQPGNEESSAPAMQSANTQVLEDAWALPAMTLATTGADGAPHAAAVYFAADEQRENLYFFSAPGSQHSLDLARDARAAASVHPLVERWQEIRGLQIRGTVRMLPPGEEWERGLAHYLVKFPFAAEMKEALSSSSLYSLRPEWIRVLDNRRGFGHKEEWTNS